jgi:hypothetical protein
MTIEEKVMQSGAGRCIGFQTKNSKLNLEFSVLVLCLESFCGQSISFWAVEYIEDLNPI